MNTSGLRILVLAPAPSFHTERFVAELRRQGCQVRLASFGNADLVDIPLKRKGPHRFFHFLLAGKQIREIINEWRPDIVNPHYASAYGFSVAQAGVQFQTPVVLNLWGGDILLAPQKSWLHRMKPVKALQCADCILGDSQYLLHEAAQLTPLKCSRVIPWGIETRFLKLHKTRYEFSGPLRIIVPRRQEQLYNNDFILEALLPFIQKHQVSLTFANIGKDAVAFQKRILRNVGQVVNFYDPMPREQYLSYLSGHDIYLSAAKTDSSPVSLIEAMALGLLPIGGDVPGVREWMTPEAGFLFNVNEKQTLTSLLDKILTDANIYSDMRRSNLERVKSIGLFENNIAEQISVMKQKADQRRR